MQDAVLGTVFMCITLMGIVAICYIFMLKLLIPKNRDEYYVFLPCDSESRNVRSLAYGMRIKMNLSGDEMYSKIVVIDCGISDEEKTSLMEICKESNGIYLINKDQIKDFLDGRI